MLHMNVHNKLNYLSQVALLQCICVVVVDGVMRKELVDNDNGYLFRDGT